MLIKPLRTRLEGAAKKTGVRLDVVQQDYLLSWVLVAISKTDKLRSTITFKGGTALKKCYFGDYRFSEDLDFNGNDNTPSGDELDLCIQNSISLAEELMNQFAPVKLSVKRYSEKDPHPNGQEAFTIYAQFPWQREPLTKAMIEITRHETMITPINNAKILHGYDENIEAEIPVYSLEEIVYEKHRAILQHIKKLQERDWSRSRSRDYYDLWSIFRKYYSSLNLKNFQQKLKLKCATKDVHFTSYEEFFNPLMLKNVERTWDQWLGPLVPSL